MVASARFDQANLLSPGEQSGRRSHHEVCAVPEARPAKTVADVPVGGTPNVA